MAIPVRINQWVQVRFQFQTNLATFLEFSLNFRAATTTVWTQAELNTLVTNLFTALSPTLLNLFTNQISLVRIIATDLSPFGTAQAVGNITSGQGVASGDTEAYNVTCVITELTGATGRSRRGRLYLPPPSDVHVVGGLFTAGYITAAGAFAAAVLAFTGGSGGRAVAWALPSRKLLQMYAITGYRIDANPDSQRRRLPGRGR